MGELVINGKKITYDVSDDTSLLWFLRENLELTGSKFGCGKGLCGSCSVLIDGDSVRSCIVKLGNVKGKSITTIEGISPNHPIIIAWQKLQVPQCGYCQSGQIISALSLLKQKPNPSESEIVDFMQGNICRCGTYMRIKKAIKQVAAEGAKA